MKTPPRMVIVRKALDLRDFFAPMMSCCTTSGSNRGRCIAHIGYITGGNLPQEAAHDFAAARLGQGISPLDPFRRGDGSDETAYLLNEFGLENIARGLIRFQGDEGINRFALDIMGESHHSGLCHGRMGLQGTFDLCRAQTVPAYIDHVVHPAGNPVVTILITPGSVAREVVAKMIREIGF